MPRLLQCVLEYLGANVAGAALFASSLNRRFMLHHEDV